MKTSITALVGLIFAFSTSGAFAQSWDGFYGGAQLGYGQTADVTGYATANPTTTWTTTDNGGDAVLGFFGGRNWSVGTSTVLGVELDVAFGDIAGTGAIVGDPAGTFGHSYSNTAALRARAGYDGGAYMPFIAIGLASTEFEFSTGGVLTPNNISRRINGTTYALGVDYAIGATGFLRAELRATSYGDEAYTGLDGIVDVTATDLGTTELRVGYAVRF